jgi:carboxymethylenebutenolidase
MLLIEDAPLDLSTPTGPMRTYLYRPVAVTGARFPGVVLFSEIYQRTGPIHRMAQIVAGQGFVVAVPEIFHELEPAGTVLPYDKSGTDRGNACKIGKPVAAYDADARAALAALAAHSCCTGALATLGVCIGGHLAFRAALQPEVRAAACFYATDLQTGSLGSGGDDTLARAGEIRGELLLVWGRQDPHIPAEARAQIEARLEETACRFRWNEVNGQHAFLRDEGPRYDPQLALTAYAQVTELFRRALA